MAASRQTLLTDLGFPDDLLERFNQCGITLFELVSCSFEDFKSRLKSSSVQWKYEVLFDAIEAWRKRNRLFVVKSFPSKPEPLESTELQGRQSAPIVGNSEEYDNHPRTTAIGNSGRTVKEELCDVPDVTPDSIQTLDAAESGENDDSLIEYGECSYAPLQNTAPATVQTTTSEVNCPIEESEHPSPAFSPKVLLSLLDATEEGKEIIEKSKIGELSEPKQLQLAGTIARFHLKNRNRLRTEDLEVYSLVVTTLFKFERKENYYICRGGDRRNHGGKIANKVANLKQKKRKSECKEQEHAKTLKLSAESVQIHEPTAKAAIEWLNLNQEPWDTVLYNWPLSFSYRKQYLNCHNFITRMFTTFPHYKAPHGYQLVDIDYRLLELGASDGLTKLEYLTPAIVSYIAKKGTDPSVVKLLKHLTNSNSNAAIRLCALLLGLSTVLPPLIVGLRFKPTIHLAQEDTIIFAESIEQVAPKVQAIYASYAARKIPIVPKIVVGESGT